jgi:hypothetical protein
MAAAERRGGAVVRAAWDKQADGQKPLDLWLEELRWKLQQMGIRAPVSWRQTERGHPW